MIPAYYRKNPCRERGGSTDLADLARENATLGKHAAGTTFAFWGYTPGRANVFMEDIQ